MTLGDIYYTLFRHKWKIVLCSFAGVAAAFGVYKLRPPPYQSEAKLFVRYVITAGKTLGPAGEADQTKSPDQGGETIMTSETEILSSTDLAAQVARIIGPEMILAKAGGGKTAIRPQADSDKDAIAATNVIQNGLTVEVPTRSSVIHVGFKHPNPEMVQPVLRELIVQYLKMHVEIHRAVGIVGDFLTQETDQLRSRLAQTEDELQKARNKAGVSSVEEARKAYADQMAKIRQDIFDTQAELAERSSVFQEISKGAPAAVAPASDSEPEVTPAQMAEYRNALARVDQFRKKEQDLLTQFTEESTRVKGVRAQLAEAESLKKKLEEEHPGLTRTVVAVPSSTADATAPAVNLVTEAARVNALQAKIKVLNAQLEEVRTDATHLDQIEGTLSELRRRKELEEANYKYYSASLEQSRIDEALGAGRVSNISQIQTPTPPSRDWAKTLKLMMGVAVGGIGVGLSWAFLIELYFDRSVRRSVDFERMLGLHLFLAIPEVATASKRGPQMPSSRQLSLPQGEDATTQKAGLVVPGATSATAIVPWNPAEALDPFHETLRDRLLSYFESKGLTHKPKLVAVTGLATGAGVTTTAAGLAKTCSETGDGNVLLVDMTVGQGSAQQFYKGKTVCGLEEILDARSSAKVESNLYVVGEEPNSDKLSRALPKRFTQLVPKLKASDFDYIIFDMPPVSQISITPRLAGFMDMVLLVVESEKTDKNLVQKATVLLAESKAHVGAVLNKTKNYVPERLHQDNLGNL